MKKQGASQKFLQILSGLMAFSILQACGPKGELTRTLHPPHKRYLDREHAPLKGGDDAHTPPAQTATASPPETGRQPPITALTTLKGLPSTCVERRSSDKGLGLCLQCQTESWIVHRCYDYKGSWDPQNECQFTPDHVKCLTKAPPFALYLDWRGSDEKFLRENFKVWAETVHQIWDDKLSGENKVESQHILQGLDLITKALSSQETITPSDSNQFITLLEIKGDIGNTLTHKFLNDLQNERLLGRMKLGLLMEKMGEFYSQVHGASPVWDNIRTLSLEGLDE